ncbi:MAG: GMC family oxidoreductase [Rhodospirillales bacterium]|nr:GMC family oxidoreductase [Rhodospirillales bacterium]
MLFDGRSVQTGSEIEGEICIIGAGAAGLAIANEFMNTNHKIILVESGGVEQDDKTQALYEGEDEPAGLENARTRFFGGSTNCWHGRCAPLDNSDFQSKDWVPHSGWPFARDELVPYYEKACQLLKIGSFKQFLSTDWDKELYPGQFFSSFKSPDSRISGVPFVESREMDRKLGPRMYERLKQSKNIHVFLNLNLTDLGLNSNRSRLKKIDVATLNGRTFSVRSNFFVLALGGLENPRLLLASDKVDPRGVGNKNDLVGRYFMGHSFTNMGEILYTNDQYCFDKESIGSPRGQLFFKLRDEFQKKSKILNAGFWLSKNISKGEMTFRYLRRDTLRGRTPDNLGEQLAEMSKNFGDVVHAAACNILGKRNRPNTWDFMVQAEDLPDPENRVTLGHQTDALQIRRLKVRRKGSDLARQTVLKASEVFAAEMTRLGMGRVKLSSDYSEGRLFRSDEVNDLELGHDIGTTRMDDNPKKGVVNSNCQLHGVENLYVAGSSVFPTSGFANPTLTIIAMAIRIAGHIKNSLQ